MFGFKLEYKILRELFNTDKFLFIDNVKSNLNIVNDISGIEVFEAPGIYISSKNFFQIYLESEFKIVDGKDSPIENNILFGFEMFKVNGNSQFGFNRGILPCPWYLYGNFKEKYFNPFTFDYKLIDFKYGSKEDKELYLKLKKLNFI